MLLDWLRSYLDNRKQHTVLNGIPSDLNTVKSGIPQGFVLGPTLFSLYTSDLPEAITTATTYMYADDTTLYCICLLYTSPSPRDGLLSRMPSSA